MRAVLLLTLLAVSGSAQAQYAACRPPLKEAAGACVAQCPAGYADTGRTCEYRNTSR